MAEKKQDVVRVLIKGRVQEIPKITYAFGKKHFGMVSEEELQLAKPIELHKPLIRPTVKPVIIKPPLKEVPEVKVPEGDPMAVEAREIVADETGDPVKPATKAKGKRKKK